MSQFFARKNTGQEGGQVLVEILVAIVVAGIIIGGVVTIIGTSITTGKKNKQLTTATNISQETIEAVKLIGESSWIDLYCPPLGSCPGGKTSSNHYKMTFANNSWTMSLGEATTTIENIEYTYYFYIDDVYRNDSGDIVTSGGDEDPSTQKITVAVSWQGGTDFSISEYVMRTTSAYFKDFNWSDGSLNDGPYTSSSGNYSTTSGDIIIDSDRSIKLSI